MNAPYVTSDTKKMLPEELAVRLEEFTKAKNVDHVHRIRGIRNMMAYTAIHNGQWSEKLQAQLKRTGRDPNTYPFLQYFVRGHAGNYITNWFDPKFVDRESDDVDVQNAVTAAQTAWYSQKDQHGYKSSALSCLEDGLCYRGIEEITIVRPSADPREWGIKFEPVRSDMWIGDPNNMSDKISRNAKQCWKLSYLSGKQMLRYFPNKEREVLGGLAKDLKKTGQDFAQLDVGAFRDIDGMKKMGSMYQVVEYYACEYEKVVHQFYDGVMLPVTQYPVGSELDVAYKKLWGMQNGMVLEDDLIITKTDWVPVLYRYTFCPDLGLELGKVKDERQLGGFLPFYSWSFIQKWGMSIGLIDLLYDCQQDINKRQMAKTKAITQTLINGKPWISEDLVQDERGGEKKLQEIVSNFNDSSQPIVTPSGMPGGSMFGIVRGDQINGALFQETTEKTNIMNLIASLPLALQGITERSGESGVHMGRKAIEGTIMNRLPMETLIEHEHDKHVDWLKLAPKVLGGPANINRVFSLGTGKNRRSITLNQFAGYDENGREIIKNDISQLKRIDVIVSQSRENDFLKQANRELDIAALQAMPPSQTNGPVRVMFESHLARSMDFQDDEQKARVNEACELAEELSLSQARILLQQAKNQEQSMSQPQTPPAGAPGIPGFQVPGAPAGGPGEGQPQSPNEEVLPQREEVPQMERTA